MITDFFGTFINGTFYGSTHELKLIGSMEGITLLEGAKIILPFMSSDSFKGTIDGKYKTENGKKGFIKTNICGTYFITNNEETFEENEQTLREHFMETYITGNYQTINDYPFVRYIVENGTEYVLPISGCLSTLSVFFEISGTKITTIDTSITSDGVYDYVKKELNEMYYGIVGKNLTEALTEIKEDTIQTMTEYEKELWKSKIKANILNNYIKYHQYLYELDTNGKTQEEIKKLYLSYSQSYKIDIVSYDNIILGLFVVGNKY